MKYPRLPMLPPLKSLFFSAAAFSAASVSAATVNWVGGSTGDWTTTTNWGSGAAPVAGNSYVVTGSDKIIITPAGTTATFAGDSLTVSGGATLQLSNVNASSTVVIPYLTIAGSKLTLTSLTSTQDSVTRTLSNSVTFANSSTIEMGNAGNFTNTLTLSNGFAGSGTLNLIRSTNDGTGRILNINGTNSTAGYSGNVSISGFDSTHSLGVNFNTASGWGSGSLSIGDYAAVISTGLSASTGSVSIGANATFALNSTLNGVLANAISGAGSFTKSGVGALVLSGDNGGFSGALALNGGVVTAGSANALGSSGVISFGGGSLKYSASNGTDYSARFSTAASQAISVDTNGQNVAFATALVSSGGSLTKSGLGTLTLSGANTYTGSTAANGGTLALDFTGDNSAKISSGVLTLGGGKLSVIGNAFAATSMAVSGLTLNAGAASVSVANGAGQTASVNVGAITRNAGGTIDFSGTGSTVTSTVNDANGIIGGYATFGGTTWAVSDGVNPVTGLISFSADLTDPTANVDVTGSMTAGGTVANTLRFNAAGATTLTLAGATTLTDGGILVSSAVGANDTTITGTSITGAASSDLVILQNNTAGSLLLNAAIVNNTLTGLTKSGAGTVVLGAVNTYTGATNVNEGTLRLGIAGAFGGAGALVIAGGAKFDANGIAFTTSALSGNGSLALGAATATVSTGTFGGVISGAGGLIKSGSGTLTLNGQNTYTGTTSLGPAGAAGGTLALGVDNALASTGILAFNGASTLALGSTSQSIAGLSLIFAGASGSSTSVVAGGGILTVSGTNDFIVENNNTSATGTVTLDMSGLNGFVYNAPTKSVNVFGNGNGRSVALTLGTSSSFTAANFYVLNGTQNTTLKSATVSLGQTTVINADNIAVLQNNPVDSASIKFRSGLTAAPTLKIRGTGGLDSNRATINIATTTTALNAQTSSTGTIDLVTGTPTSVLDAMVDTLNLGARTGGGTSTTTLTAIFSMGAGTLDATNINLGNLVTGSSFLNSTFSVTNGGLVKVGTLTMGVRTGGTLTSTLNLNGGSTLAAQTVQAGSGTVTRNFNWNDGTVKNYDASTDLTVGSGLTLTLAATGNHAFVIDSGRAGTIGAVIAGSGLLTNSGAGTLTLSGANTYTGGTLVSGGTLVASSLSALGTGSVTIASGSRLQVGATGVTLSADGAILAINGTLTVGSTGISGGSGAAVVALTGAGTSYAFNGTLDLNGLFNSAASGQYTLITATGANTDTAVTIAGFTSTTNVASFSNGVLTLTAVPEPSTYGLIGAGALASVALVRRRRKAV